MHYESPGFFPGNHMEGCSSIVEKSSVNKRGNYARLGSEGEAYICSSSILKRTWKIRVARSNFILCNKLIATFNPMCHLQLQAMSSRAFSAA